jgi:hypothetical protein
VKATARRRIPGTMNRLEQRYAQQLELEKRDGLIIHWAYEALTVKLADATRLTVDFFVIVADGSIDLRETKGFMREEAWCKLKTAAALYPWFRFLLVRKANKNSGAEWIIQEIPANGTTADVLRASPSKAIS